MITQNMFLWRNKKDISIFRMKKAPYLLLWLSEYLQYDKCPKILYTTVSDKMAIANSTDPNLTTPEVWAGSPLFVIPQSI